uniref:Uncharacterized protein n=1 Tax=Sphaerodactylus townsendi TaxID=933632 RepID=A0ACB8F271_9SAUR
MLVAEPRWDLHSETTFPFVLYFGASRRHPTGYCWKQEPRLSAFLWSDPAEYFKHSHKYTRRCWSGQMSLLSYLILSMVASIFPARKMKTFFPSCIFNTWNSKAA